MSVLGENKNKNKETRGDSLEIKEKAVKKEKL